jgi:hypothetical protein
MVDLSKVAAHYAVSSLFEPYEERTRIYSHRVHREDQDTHTGGKRRLALGRIRVESEITREAATFSYGVLHLGDHNISGGVRPYQGLESYKQMKGELTELFRRDYVPEIIRAVDRLFGDGIYTLQFLFRDEQHKIVRILLESALDHASALYRSFYREYGPLARFLAGLAIPLPHRFRVAIEFTLHQDLEAVLSAEDLDAAAVRSLVEQIHAAGIGMDAVTLEFTARRALERLAHNWREHPGEIENARRLDQALDVFDMLPFQLNVWKAQNIAYDILKRFRDREGAGEWYRASVRLAQRLGVAV